MFFSMKSTITACEDHIVLSDFPIPTSRSARGTDDLSLVEGRQQPLGRYSSHPIVLFLPSLSEANHH